MRVFENKGMAKSAQKLLKNTFLAVLEFILTEGVEGVLGHISDATEEEVGVFPHVAQALREKGFLK